MEQLLSAQYQLIRGARGALFQYLHSIPSAELLRPVPAFNNSSILALLTHVANSYLHWLEAFDQGVAVNIYKDEAITTVNNAEEMFKAVDVAVTDFLSRYKVDYERPFTKKHPRRGIMIATTPLMLYTHVTTHEFHHKGQILTMSRLLGYTPVDTDVIRF